MNHQPISTHPILQDFFKLRMTDKGQLIVNEEVAHQHIVKNTMSICCQQETYQMDGVVICGYCGHQTSVNY